MANSEPTSGVVQFVDFLKKRGVKLEGKAVDIGAGKGRNAVYLARLGFEVCALEYIKAAAIVGKELAKARSVANNVNYFVTEVDKVWRFPDNYFSIAIDSFSSIDIETMQGREKCRDEMYRTLIPGGFALVNVCSINDEWEKELIEKYPGPEPNSTVWPQNGKFQKDYSEQELREFYKIFEVVELESIYKEATKLGRKGTATNFWAVLKKAKNCP
jgi:ubiquinone/menaquinone biosynthesis C-methylase UbiE